MQKKRSKSQIDNSDDLSDAQGETPNVPLDELLDKAAKANINVVVQVGPSFREEAWKRLNNEMGGYILKPRSDIPIEELVAKLKEDFGDVVLEEVKPTKRSQSPITVLTATISLIAGSLELVRFVLLTMGR